MNPCNPCNPCLKNKKHQLKTKQINYEQQRKQQNHVGQDSPRSDNDFNRHCNHLRGDIVHGALVSLHRRILRKINKYPHCPFLQGGDILYAQNMAEKNKLKEE